MTSGSERETLLPGMRDRGVLLLFALVVGLQLLSWSTIHGYQLADSVEYMERAQAFARGQQVIDHSGIRPLGFSALLVPQFWLADRLGLADLRPLVWTTRLLQMGLGLLLVRAAVRLGALLGGRGIGLVAGYLVAVNPVFLQYSVAPVSGIAAGICMAEALEAVLRPAGFRRGLRCGLWLGAGLLMAYQTILITIPLLGLVLLRDRSRAWRLGFGGVLLGLLVGVLAQIAMDRVHYGEWGASLWRYFLGNFGTILARVIGQLGFHDVARDIYRLTVETAFESSEVSPGATPADLRQLTSQYFYVIRLPSMLVWPVLLLATAGLARSVRRPSWTSSILVALILCNVGVMSLKGSKDFRLWLPLLPLIAPICALGWGLVRGTAVTRPAPWRAAVSALLLLAALGLGVQTLLADNRRKFGGYWDAIRFVNETARSSRARMPGAPRVAVTSARHWAVFLQESPDVALTKLPRDLDFWGSNTEEQRQADLDAILDGDWFLVHIAVLWNHPELSRAINAAFEVRAVFGDRLTYEDIGPVFVFSKPTGSPDAKRLFRLVTDEDPDEYFRRHGLTSPITFTRELVLRRPETNAVYDHHEEVVFLGWEFEEMPGDGHGWITYHWLCRSEMKGDYTIVDRLDVAGELDGWSNAHRPAYGNHPTRSDLQGGWQPGWILEESYVMIAAADPYEWQLPYRPLGGAYRRGDLVPATLWIGLATFDAKGVTGRMVPSNSGGRGWNVSEEGLARGGGCFLPVQAPLPETGDGRAASN